MCAMANPKPATDNVIELSVINGKLGVKPEVRYKKDGSIDNRHSNKVAGVSSEVYPFTSSKEIKAMIDVFNNRIDEATSEHKRMIACRNKMLFLIGINLGIRASDLCGLKYSFFMNNDGTFKDGYSLKPKKTRNHNKFVKLYFNEVVKKAITDFVNEYPYDDIDNYIFKSQKGDGALTEKTLWKIVVEAATEAGLKKNYGSHSLRKTFGYWVWHNSKDKNKSLVLLQAIFNHNSTATTAKYIGITDDEIEDVFNELNLGIDFV